jgi:Tfp pilus assembly protein PilN
VQRELAAVEARRAELRRPVARALAERETLLAAAAREAAVARLEGSGRRWSVELANLAPNLPRHAHLTSFRAEGDTVLLAGTAHDALDVVRALSAAPGVARVTPEAPVRREIGEGGPRERFELSLRLGAAAPPRRGRP